MGGYGTDQLHVDESDTGKGSEGEEERVKGAGGDVEKSQGYHVGFEVAVYSCHVAGCLSRSGIPSCKLTRGAPTPVDRIQRLCVRVYGSGCAQENSQ